MPNSNLKEQEKKDFQLNWKVLRAATEFDLYKKANDFVKEEMLEKGYKISKTRLENLSRAFRISYQTFSKLIEKYLVRLQREADEARPPKADIVRSEWQILEKIKTQCGLAILEQIPLQLKHPESREARRQQAKLKEKYIEILAQSWFTHFVSACLGCPPDEKGDLPYIR